MFETIKRYFRKEEPEVSPTELTEDMIRNIVFMLRSLPKNLSTSIMMHPKTPEEYKRVRNLMDELNMTENENSIKTADYFGVTFFNPEMR